MFRLEALDGSMTIFKFTWSWTHSAGTGLGVVVDAPGPCLHHDRNLEGDPTERASRVASNPTTSPMSAIITGRKLLPGIGGVGRSCNDVLWSIGRCYLVEDTMCRSTRITRLHTRRHRCNGTLFQVPSIES